MHRADCKSSFICRSTCPSEHVERHWFKGLQANKALSVSGENFVTQDLNYVKQLAVRHPDKYEVFVEFKMQSGTKDALIGSGARDASKIVQDAGLQDLPLIKKGMTNSVHIKGEGEAINYGLREGSQQLFNDRIIKFKTIPKGDLK